MSVVYFCEKSRDMEDYLVVFGFVAAILGILNLILFFKIWDMTDNIKFIKKKVELYFKHKESENSDNIYDPIFEAKVAYYQKDKSTAKQILDKAFYTDLVKISHLEYSYNEEYRDLMVRYKPFYDAMELDSPDFELYKDKENL